VRTLLGRLKAIRDPGMRVTALVESLTTGDPERVVEVLRALAARARVTADADATLALDTLAVALSEPDRIPYPVLSELYAVAKTAGHREIAQLLFSAGATVPAGGGRTGDGERPVEPRGRPVTLGERKALARGHRRGILTHLLREPHPDVVRILLGNPHLTERDVLSIASRRPTEPSCQVAVFASPRWRPRYAVRRALVMNPYTPAALALRIMLTLRARDLEEIAGDPRLPAPLRVHAEDLLRVRP
jgi:hypothetical protein